MVGANCNIHVIQKYKNNIFLPPKVELIWIACFLIFVLGKFVFEKMFEMTRLVIHTNSLSLCYSFLFQMLSEHQINSGGCWFIETALARNKSQTDSMFIDWSGWVDWFRWMNFTLLYSIFFDVGFLTVCPTIFSFSLYSICQKSHLWHSACDILDYTLVIALVGQPHQIYDGKMH